MIHGSPSARHFRADFEAQRPSDTPVTCYEWVHCIGKKGALCRSERDLGSQRVCEIAPKTVVRKIGLGAAHKKDGSTERRLRVLIPGDPVMEGWVSAKLFIACAADESDLMDMLHIRSAGMDNPFRAPPAEVARDFLREARASRRESCCRW